MKASGQTSAAISTNFTQVFFWTNSANHTRMLHLHTLLIVTSLTHDNTLFIPVISLRHDESHCMADLCCYIYQLHTGVLLDTKHIPVMIQSPSEASATIAAI